MNIEDDDTCTADYGVFGNLSCNCSVCRPAIPPRDLARERQAEQEQKRRDEREKVSRDFNSHMIHLYDQGRRS